MVRLALLGLLVPATAVGDRIDFSPPPRRIDTTTADAELGLARLAAGIRARNTGMIRRQLADEVTFEGAWFGDAKCRRRFGSRAVITGSSNLRALAKCLATNKLQVTTRQSSLDDGGVLTLEPGIELEVAFDGSRVRWISFESQATTDPLLPTLTAQAFEALRTAGTTSLDAAVGKQLDPTIQHAGSASAWVRVCLATDGTIASTTFRELAPSLPAVETAFAAAIRDWKFKPFLVGGVPTAACGLSQLTYPTASAPSVEVLPVPLSPASLVSRSDDEDGIVDLEDDTPPVNVAPAALEQMRVAGRKTIRPDDVTKKAIHRAGAWRIVGLFKMCVDTTGRVSTVTMLKSTGYPGYDAKIQREMRTWRYRPYKVNNTPTPVCTAVTFIYRQSP